MTIIRLTVEDTNFANVQFSFAIAASVVKQNIDELRCRSVITHRAWLPACLEVICRRPSRAHR